MVPSLVGCLLLFLKKLNLLKMGEITEENIKATEKFERA